MTPTTKKLYVDPPLTAPNSMTQSPGLQRLNSLTAFITGLGFSFTRKAAKLAVYDDTMISVKNHQKEDAKRAEADLWFKSELS